MSRKRTEEKELRFSGSKRRSRVFDLVQIALMSAVLCVLAPIAIPVPMSPVPVTLGLFAVYLVAVLLGAGKGAVSVLVYLLLGMAGLPVFSGFHGGAATLFGPTGGYLMGYLPAAWLIGWCLDRPMKQHDGRTKRIGQVLRLAGVLLCGTVVCYGFGTVWFVLVMGGTYTLAQALLVCVVPFLPLDGIKIVLASGIVLPVRQKLRRAGILEAEEFFVGRK